MTRLLLESVSHAFGHNTVVRDVTVGVEEGELACLLGPSGCGKTTLLRLVAGLEPLQHGRISLGERIVADAGAGTSLPPEARGVGLMFQDYALFPHLTVLENVLFGVPRHRRDRHDWARSALEGAGLADQAASYPHTLSGGQQQRAALLRALAPEPRILLLDEPFSGLDVTLRVQIREETLGLLKETGVTILMVTHDPEEAMFMADRVLVMDGGVILQSGTPIDAYFHPVNPFVAELFGPINRIPGTVAGGAVTTPVGRFAAAGHPDGARVEVLIRPEGISLVSDGSVDTVATVVSARLLGRSTSLRLICTDGTLRLHARIPGVVTVEPGCRLVLRVNPTQAFVFPAP